MNELKNLILNIKILSKNQKHAIHLTQKYKPDCVFLQETYVNTESKAQDIKIKMGVPDGYFRLGPFGCRVALFNCSDKWEITNTERLKREQSSPLLKKMRVIIQVQSFIIKRLSFRPVSFVQE